jgi:hypothetical protein
MILLTIASLSPMDRYKLGLVSWDNRSAAILARQRHRALHWLSFGGLAFLVTLLGRNRRERLLAPAAVAGLGVSIEYLQHVIYANALETWDIRDDLFACLAGLLCALLVLAAKSGLSKPT